MRGGARGGEPEWMGPSVTSLSSTIMVDIYLNVHGSQGPFLTIPDSDIQRLAIHPFRWLQYVMFSICGAYGNLSAMPDGPPVNYDCTSMVDNIYYYNPLGDSDCIFVDYKGSNDQITSSSLTDHHYNFREDVIHRDGLFCVITQHPAEHCDATHLIPRSKGDEYIKKVVQDHSPLYHPSPSISGIDDVQNGVLLWKGVHSFLFTGEVAFLKTPNYGLNPTDIQRLEVNQGPTSGDHITLQQLKKPIADNPAALATITNIHPCVAFILGAHVDAQFQGTEISLPPAVILDYMYGVAAYKCWRSSQADNEVHNMMKSYHKEHYADIPVPPCRPSNNDNGSSKEQDHAYGPDDPPTTLPQQRCYIFTRRGDTMAKTMDELNSVLMHLQGITPQEAANRREKQLKEEEQKAQEASQSKVIEWMKTSIDTSD
ncbi:hypothetical protein DFH94DRAFT_365059 [Russula ochroleuca]|uniref:HNH nuclease domain-containing protein n=1 Tax=Russula ochroleuca TaxID=152965 RepID=A0A9P5MZE4_9AGAM|nr:hypothetical protein DFH94DRAFT_365059 [Russula ochroleuca]